MEGGAAGGGTDSQGANAAAARALESTLRSAAVHAVQGWLQACPVLLGSEESARSASARRAAQEMLTCLQQLP